LHIVIHVILIPKILCLFSLILLSKLTLFVLLYSSFDLINLNSFLVSIITQQISIVFLHISSQLMNKRPLLIKQETVSPHLTEMCMHLCSRSVRSTIEMTLNSRQIHRFLHNIIIIRTSIPLRIHRSQKRKRTFMLLQLR